MSSGACQRTHHALGATMDTVRAWDRSCRATTVCTSGLTKCTATVTFTAPDSGDYEGMLFWSDDDAPYRSVGSMIAGTSNSTFTGAMYFPSTHLTWAGTSSTSAWNMIVAKTIKIAGNAVVASDYDSTTIGVPTRKATLVE